MAAAGDTEVVEMMKKLPEVPPHETADGEKFDCPQPWFLALLTVAMSAMTSITVAGALFFLLAAPEKVSPHCYARDDPVKRILCTVSSVCFWTYPVVCCLFVVLLYAKNLVDQRLYYEFLLHGVVIGYPRNQAWKNPTVLMLLVYALCAFSALIWHGGSQLQIEVSHVYSALAYITPIISFLAVIMAQWSIQGKLVTLPNFLEDFQWGVKHLNESKCYNVDKVHAGYTALERALERTDEPLDTPRLVALVEHYTKTLAKEEKTDVEAQSAQPQEPQSHRDDSIVEAEKLVEEVGEKVVKEYVYWQVRLLFNPRLQDDRSQSFRNWALAYMVTVMLAVILAVYLYACCLITCLEIERVLVPGTPAFTYFHYFSLRPDLGHSNHQSLKQLAASAAFSFINKAETGRGFFSKAMPQFQIGAAA